MNDFIKFIDKLTSDEAIHVSIYCSKTLDWCITVWKKGCAEDYPGTKTSTDGKDAILCDVQSSDIELCFAKAQVAVKEWLIKYKGGY